MSDNIQPILIIVAGLVGAVSIIYFYVSTDVFSDIVRQPLRLISGGMLAIDTGIVLVALTAYEATKGHYLNLLGIPLPTCFYALYLIGTIMIVLGARKFTSY